MDTITTHNLSVCGDERSEDSEMSGTNEHDTVVMCDVGDIIEWQEDDGYGGILFMRSNIINRDGELWVNGCGSLKEIDRLYSWEVVNT